MYSPARWRRALAEAGFQIDRCELLPRIYDLYTWLDRARTPERQRHLIFRKIAGRNARLVKPFPAVLDGPAPFLQPYFVKIVAIQH